jgi:hypothetical protein
MAINVHPNRIQVPSGNSGGNSGRTGRRHSQTTGDNTGQGDVIVPKRADVNYIPGPESLQTFIHSAVEALRLGRTWDRGTILNLLV